MNVNYQFIQGPSRYASFAGVLLTFGSTFENEFSADTIEDMWERLVGNGQALWHPVPVDHEVSFTELCVSIARYLYKPIAFMDVDKIAFGQDLMNAQSWIILRQLHPEIARIVLTGSVQLAHLLFSALTVGNIPQGCSSFITNIQNQIERMEPSEGVQTLIRAALAREIPVYSIVRTTELYWQFGQGVYSRLISFTSSDSDSRIGTELCHNKVFANDFVVRLGFPGVVHGAVHRLEGAIKMAEKIGYPLVVKPVLGAMGIGVTANVKNLQELQVAYRNAEKYSGKGILIERYIEGTDHRISLFGGKVVWVSAKYPAQVVGDGSHTVAELINLENQRRAQEGGSKQAIEMDRETTEMLAQNSLDYSYCPKSGEVIKLRTVANLSQGGTRIDVSDRIHPDNRYMAESLAKAFRMDSLGIDFITQDISTSWREGSCGIIELNQSPGFSEPWQGALYLDALFPAPDTRSRILTVLLVECSAQQQEEIVSELSRNGYATALVQPSSTRFNGFSRGYSGDGLHARATSMVLDPSCEALVISTDTKQILLQGLPLDRLDLALITDEVTLEAGELLKAHCRFVADVSTNSSGMQQHLQELMALHRKHESSHS